MLQGARLKEMRQAKGLSVVELARLAHLPERQLLEIEAGDREVSPRAFEKLIPVLDIQEADELSWHQLVTGDIGTKLRALREKQGYTLAQLGALADVSLTYLSEIELGEKVPSFTTLRAITDVLQVPVSLFVGNKRKQSIIGQKLKRARTMVGMTQKELAYSAGVSIPMIAQLENGKIQASLQTIEQISKVLGVSVCYLILEQEEVEEMIGAITPEMRELMFDPRVQKIIGSICTMEKEEIVLVLNFINMLKNPYIQEKTTEKKGCSLE